MWLWYYVSRGQGYPLSILYQRYLAMNDIIFAAFGTAPTYKELGFRGTIELCGTQEEVKNVLIAEKRETVCVQGACYGYTDKHVWYVMVKDE